MQSDELWASIEYVNDNLGAGYHKQRQVAQLPSSREDGGIELLSDATKKIWSRFHFMIMVDCNVTGFTMVCKSDLWRWRRTWPSRKWEPSPWRVRRYREEIGRAFRRWYERHRGNPASIILRPERLVTRDRNAGTIRCNSARHCGTLRRPGSASRPSGNTKPTSNTSTLRLS